MIIKLVAIIACCVLILTLNLSVFHDDSHYSPAARGLFLLTRLLLPELYAVYTNVCLSVLEFIIILFMFMFIEVIQTSTIN